MTTITGAATFGVGGSLGQPQAGRRGSTRQGSHDGLRHGASEWIIVANLGRWRRPACPRSTWGLVRRSRRLDHVVPRWAVDRGRRRLILRRENRQEGRPRPPAQQAVAGGRSRDLQLGTCAHRGAPSFWYYRPSQRASPLNGRPFGSVATGPKGYHFHREHRCPGSGGESGGVSDLARVCAAT
jgi:hypothetical protein